MESRLRVQRVRSQSTFVAPLFCGCFTPSTTFCTQCVHKPYIFTWERAWIAGKLPRNTADEQYTPARPTPAPAASTRTRRQHSQVVSVSPGKSSMNLIGPNVLVSRTLGWSDPNSGGGEGGQTTCTVEAVFRADLSFHHQGIQATPIQAPSHSAS